MKKEKKTTIGIICEYNPFHNGHLYHLQQIKEMFPNSLIVLVLNGYFCERGEVSIISKKDKTLIALAHGIDIVVELPFVFGTQSADTFANASLTYLENLGCDYVIFGSESNDLKKLNILTDYMLNNENYDLDVKKYLKEGVNYPTSLAKALNIDFKLEPNDLLGISYLKVIKQNKFNIKPLTIKRTNDYLDTLSDDTIVSASNIREKITNNKDIAKYIPDNVISYINKINLNDFFSILQYKIIECNNLNIYQDVDEGIEFRIKKVILKANNVEELINLIKSKRYTYNKIKRMLIHILVGFTKEDNQKLKITYLKVLGFSKDGQEYLNKIKKELNISLIPVQNSIIYKYELKCAFIYSLITNNKDYLFDISNKPIITLLK